MSELRQHPRVAVHYPVTLRHGELESRGTTENLSERGAMISLASDAALVPGLACEIMLELPGLGPVVLASRIRWASAVLPGVLGVEFGRGAPPELAAHVAQLLDS